MAKVTFDVDALRRFGIKSKRKMVRVMRASVLEAAAQIIERTPVDTGFARAGWYATVNGVAQGETFASFEFQKAELGDRIGLASNVEYIRPLEYGHSEQAPLGMVRVTAALWPSIVGDIAKREALK